MASESKILSVAPADINPPPSSIILSETRGVCTCKFVDILPVAGSASTSTRLPFILTRPRSTPFTGESTAPLFALRKTGWSVTRCPGTVSPLPLMILAPLVKGDLTRSSCRLYFSLLEMKLICSGAAGLNSAMRRRPPPDWRSAAASSTRSLPPASRRENEMLVSSRGPLPRRPDFGAGVTVKEPLTDPLGLPADAEPVIQVTSSVTRPRDISARAD